MDLAKSSETFLKNVFQFQNICKCYKSILDSNFSGRFCINGDCKTIFMVEIKSDGSEWGATPKIFDSEKEAEKEIQTLKLKYPFISETRVITRRIEEKEEN